MIKVGDKVKISDKTLKYFKEDMPCPGYDPVMLPEMIEYIGNIVTVASTDSDGHALRFEEIPYWWADWQVDTVFKATWLMDTE